MATSAARSVVVHPAAYNHCVARYGLHTSGLAILEDARWLGTSYVGWLYPVYILLSAVIAWVCYPQRRTIAWILVALIVITMAGLFVTIGLV